MPVQLLSVEGRLEQTTQMKKNEMKKRTEKG
jgi:hypothetical protein